jgi:hypothetical protein
MDKKAKNPVVYHTVQVFDEHIPPAEGEGGGPAGASPARATPGKIVQCAEIAEFHERAVSPSTDSGALEGQCHNPAAPPPASTGNTG